MQLVMEIGGCSMQDASEVLYRKVFEHGKDVVDQIQNTQQASVTAAAKLIADSFLNHKSFFVSGSGHSHTVAEEFYGRAGGLAFVKPILTSELTLTEHPTKSSYIERLSGYASILADLYHISEGDVVLIASNSGRNSYPVELSLRAKERGASVVAITSRAHSDATTSRDPSGKHLLDIADVVIDNCGVPGDACMEVDGVRTAMCPTSSIANAFIVQAISVLVAQFIVEAGEEPPVFVSLNSQGTGHMNDELYSTYTRLY